MKKLKQNIAIILKIIILTIIICFCNQTFGNGNILEKRISISVNNESIVNVIDKIGDIAKINFSYNSNIIPVDLKVTLNENNESVKNILDKILNDNALKYKVVEKQIIIYKDNNNSSEKPENFETIRGIILDNDSKKGLPFSHIHLEGKSIGTTSNDSGEFVLKIPKYDIRDSIVVSYIGYKTITLPVSSLDSGATKIELVQIPTELEAINVRPVDPKLIIINAVSLIKKNYESNPLKMNAFYRETVKRDSLFLSVSEAVLSIYKAPYNQKNAKDQVKLVMGRKSKSVKPSGFIGVKIEGGPYNIVNLDIAKNKIDFLEKRNFKYYDFTLKGIINYMGRKTYVINFDQKDGIIDSHFQGSIYIDKETFAIVSTKFGLSPKGIKYARKLFIEESPDGVFSVPIDADYEVNYRLLGNKWYLSNIRGQNEIIVYKNKKERVSIFKNESLLAITAHDSTNIEKFNNKETLKQSDILVDLLGNADEKFWENYNFVKPLRMNKEVKK